MTASVNSLIVSIVFCWTASKSLNQGGVLLSTLHDELEAISSQFATSSSWNALCVHTSTRVQKSFSKGISPIPVTMVELYY